MLNVIGIVHSKGEYQGTAYDNFNLHCTLDSDPNNSNQDGILTEVVKIKSSLFVECDINIGDTIELSYDKFGRIKDIQKF